MFTLERTRPLAKSICDGSPMPIAAGRPVLLLSSSTVSSSPPIRSSALDRKVGCSTEATTSDPCTCPTATLVPPTSTPNTTSSGPADMARIFPDPWSSNRFGPLRCAINAADGPPLGPQEPPHRPDRRRDLPLRVRGRLLRGGRLLG